MEKFELTLRPSCPAITTNIPQLSDKLQVSWKSEVQSGMMAESRLALEIHGTDVAGPIAGEGSHAQHKTGFSGFRFRGSSLGDSHCHGRTALSTAGSLLRCWHQMTIHKPSTISKNEP
jgi:hypothetical protein